MIIWIDGANGVGKSHTARNLAELLSDKNAEYVESDQYWEDILQNDDQRKVCGTFPYYDKYFLDIFREMLESKIHDFGKMPIVSMSLVSGLCETELLDYFKKKKVSMLHIILEAKEDTIISRIENDPCRNESAKNQQKKNVPSHIRYLRLRYPDAVRVNTEDMDQNEIAAEIITLL